MDGRERSAGVQPAKRPALAHLASRALASSRKTTRALLTLWKGLCYFMDVKANEDVPLGVQPPTPPRARRIVPRLGSPGAGMERAWSFVRTFRPIEPTSLDPWLFCAGCKKGLARDKAVCYTMRRFPVGYQSGQLGRTVNPLALPSYVRIVDPPPFFARGFGHGFFVFPTLFLHENTKGRKGLGTRGGVTAAPENRERRTENRARDKRATDGAVGTMLTAPFPRRHKRPNRRCRRSRRYRSAPAGASNKPLCRAASGRPLARRRRAGGAGRTSPCRSVGQRPTSNYPIF